MILQGVAFALMGMTTLSVLISAGEIGKERKPLSHGVWAMNAVFSGATCLFYAHFLGWI